MGGPSRNDGFDVEFCLEQVGSLTIRAPCAGFSMADLARGKPADGSSLSWIEERGIQWIYVDEQAWSEADWQSLLRALATSTAWHPLAPASVSQEHWAVFQRAVRDGASNPTAEGWKQRHEQ